MTDDEIERSFAWSNMFVRPEDDPRVDRRTSTEVDTLKEFLLGYRQTLELKCRGLDGEQLALRSVPPSNMSLLGLIRHMADVERFWFRMVLGGEDVQRVFRSEDEPDLDFNGASGDSAVVEQAWRLWREEVANSERFVEEAPSLDLTGKLFDPPGEEISLREVLVHMIEEYARHCGHADLIRERIDGRVGQ